MANKYTKKLWLKQPFRVKLLLSIDKSFHLKVTASSPSSSFSCMASRGAVWYYFPSSEEEHLCHLKPVKNAWNLKENSVTSSLEYSRDLFFTWKTNRKMFIMFMRIVFFSSVNFCSPDKSSLQFLCLGYSAKIFIF